ncbi:ATP-binding protein [Lysinibacillus sp. B2A1]|nr:ATP-binding protein [Lysinibacillus sp. B2A1]
MEFTLNVNPDTQAIAFVDQVMENYSNVYNLPYKKELRFVVHELVINAVEAMGKINTCSKKEIQIHVCQSNEEIKVTVTDEAKGIAENDWDKVLQYDFNELDYSDRGRGLFFVKNMVDDIWFEHISETKFLVGISKRIYINENREL